VRSTLHRLTSQSSGKSLVDLASDAAGDPLSRLATELLLVLDTDD
jgi:hypothetical protein